MLLVALLVVVMVIGAFFMVVIMRGAVVQPFHSRTSFPHCGGRPAHSVFAFSKKRKRNSMLVVYIGVKGEVLHANTREKPDER